MLIVLGLLLCFLLFIVLDLSSSPASLYSSCSFLFLLFSLSLSPCFFPPSSLPISWPHAPLTHPRLYFVETKKRWVRSAPKDFGVGPYERALLPSLEIVGVALGSFAGGYVGDHVGRKPPIVATYLSVGFLSAGPGA